MNTDYLKQETKILNIITEVFIAMIIIVFPLLVNSTGFFKILETKWYSYLTIMSAYIMIILSVLMYFGLLRGINFFEGKKITKVQIALLGFLVVSIISCLLSPYYEKYNLFVGTNRREGLINIILYSLSFLMISVFGKFDKRQVMYFPVSAILINTICILQYFGFNPFNMYRNGIGTHNVSFMGTIGNVDFISAIFCILMVVSFVAFVFLENNRKDSIIHYIAIIMISFIFQIIDVDSGKIGMLAILILLIPYLLSNNKFLSRTLKVLAGVVFGYCLDLILNLKYYYSLGKLKFEIQFNTLNLILLVTGIIVIILSMILRKKEYDLSNNRKFIIGVYIFMLVGILVIVTVLYVININVGILHDIHEILHGNFEDNHGTYRGFLWKRAIKLVKDYPIIGTGPDSFAIRFMSKYKDDVEALGKLTINDTAANVYLTMLINIGILGTLIYVVAIFIQTIDVIKALFSGNFSSGMKSSKAYYYIFSLTIICFAVQDIFNLWIVIVVPIFFTLMGINQMAKGSSEKEVKSLKNGV